MTTRLVRFPPAALGLLLLTACPADPKDGDDTGDDTSPADTDTDTGETGTDSEDSGETGDSAETGETGETGETADTGTADVSPMEVTATLSEEIVTVVRVSWTTAHPSRGRVRFGESEAYTYVTNLTELGTEHSVLLVGNPADTLVHFDVETEGPDGGEGRSGDLSITTGSLPADVPGFVVTGEVVSWVDDFLVFPAQGAKNAIVMVDSRGRVVWYDVLEPGNNLMKAILSHDKQHVIECIAGPQDFLEIGHVDKVSLDGSERTIMPFPYVDHDITELPDGTIAGIVVTEESGFPNTADRIVELQEDGTQTDIWSAWDDTWLANFYDSNFHNWTHANALNYVADEGAYYISLKELGTIVKIDRASGEPIWYLNGDGNEFDFPDGVDPGYMQHQFQILPGGILLFDNGPPERNSSRAWELALDDVNMTVEDVWSYYHTPPIAVYAKGDVERYADGNTRVVWSTAGEIQDVTPDGEVLWQLNTALGTAITFVQRAGGLYPHEE